MKVPCFFFSVFFRHDLVLSVCLVLLTGVMHKLLTPFSSFAQFSGIITVYLDDYEKFLTLSYIYFFFVLSQHVFSPIVELVDI